MKMKPGRKPMKESDKVKMVGVYIKPTEKKAIISEHGSLTNAVRKLILPTLKTN